MEAVDSLAAAQAEVGIQIVVAMPVVVTVAVIVQGALTEDTITHGVDYTYMTNRAERRRRTEIVHARRMRDVRRAVARAEMRADLAADILAGANKKSRTEHPFGCPSGRCKCGRCSFRPYERERRVRPLDDQILEEWADNEDDYSIRNTNCFSVRPGLGITTRGEARDRVLYWALAEGEARSFAELSNRITEWVTMLELDE